MAALGRGRVGGGGGEGIDGKVERGSGRPESELLLHPELLSEEFLLLTLEQVRPGAVGEEARPLAAGPEAGRGGLAGLRPCLLS